MIWRIDINGCSWYVPDKRWENIMYESPLFIDTKTIIANMPSMTSPYVMSEFDSVVTDFILDNTMIIYRSTFVKTV